MTPNVCLRHGVACSSFKELTTWSWALPEPPLGHSDRRDVRLHDGFNRSLLQHTKNSMRRRCAAGEAPDANLLLRFPKGIDVGAMEARLSSSPSVNCAVATKRAQVSTLWLARRIQFRHRSDW